MPADQLDIHASSVVDNLDERQVEFDGEVDGEEYRFAVHHSVIEALTGTAPDGDAAESFEQFVDVIKDAALSALARDADPDIIVVTENDLDQ